jgi:hypothetical protein
LGDKGLLVYAEQGFGDSLQFCRYASLIKQKFGGRIYVEVRQPLARLTSSLANIEGVVVYGDDIPACVKYCIPMLSLPRIFKTVLNTIPSNTPYFRVGESRKVLWRERLKQLPPGLRVGLCWAGQNRINQPAASAIDARRSISLAQCVPLAVIPGISWVSLQKGSPALQSKNPPPGMTIGDWSEEMEDFYDTAALIDCLDLVISVDTSVVHVAGAMGKPTWLLSRFDGCWRWMGRETKKTRWYPSLTQFSQTRPNDWTDVIQNVAGELKGSMKNAAAA